MSGDADTALSAAVSELTSAMERGDGPKRASSVSSGTGSTAARGASSARAKPRAAPGTSGASGVSGVSGASSGPAKVKPMPAPGTKGTIPISAVFGKKPGKPAGTSAPTPGSSGPSVPTAASSSKGATTTHGSSSSSTGTESTKAPGVPVSAPAVPAGGKPPVGAGSGLPVELDEAEKKRIEREQRLLTEKVELRFSKMQSETARLERIRGELRALSAPSRQDINIVRQNIEKVERDTGWYRRNYEAKKKAFEEADRQLKEKEEEKRRLVAHLNVIMSDISAKKQAKLKEINEELRKLSSSGGFSGFS